MVIQFGDGVNVGLLQAWIIEFQEIVKIYISDIFISQCEGVICQSIFWQNKKSCKQCKQAGVN